MDGTASEDRFDMGRVMRRTFSAWASEWPKMIVFGLIGESLPQAAQSGVHLWLSQQGADNAAVWQSTLLASPVNAVAGAYAAGALIFAVLARFEGRQASWGSCLNAGLKQWLSIFLIRLLSGLGITFGLFLLLIPGLMAATRWAMSAPAQVSQHKGGRASMGLSARLARGHMWSIFRVGLALFLIAIVISMVIIAIGDAILSAAAPGFANSLDALVITPVSMLGMTLLTVGTASLYFELTGAAGHIRADKTAEVFS